MSLKGVPVIEISVFKGYFTEVNVSAIALLTSSLGKQYGRLSNKEAQRCC